MEAAIEDEMEEDKQPQPLVADMCLCVCVFTHLIACLWDVEGWGGAESKMHQFCFPSTSNIISTE